MGLIKLNLFCRDCGHEEEVDVQDFECPNCKSDNVSYQRFLVCDCGEEVLLDAFTNICPTCGAMYNGFGQRLAPVGEWEPEDVYGTFGPQN